MESKEPGFFRGSIGALNVWFKSEVSKNFPSRDFGGQPVGTRNGIHFDKPKWVSWGKASITYSTVGTHNLHV